MANEKAEWQKELEEINEEYKELQEEANAELEMIEAGVGATQIHGFNIAIGTMMTIIGLVLVYQTRNGVRKSGKKIAGWILLVLGILAVLTHTIQLIF